MKNHSFVDLRMSLKGRQSGGEDPKARVPSVTLVAFPALLPHLRMLIITPRS